MTERATTTQAGDDWLLWLALSRSVRASVPRALSAPACMPPPAWRFALSNDEFAFDRQDLDGNPDALLKYPRAAKAAIATVLQYEYLASPTVVNLKEALRALYWASSQYGPLPDVSDILTEIGIQIAAMSEDGWKAIEIEEVRQSVSDAIAKDPKVANVLHLQSTVTSVNNWLRQHWFHNDEPCRLERVHRMQIGDLDREEPGDRELIDSDMESKEAPPRREQGRKRAGQITIGDLRRCYNGTDKEFRSIWRQTHPLVLRYLRMRRQRV